MARFVGVSPPTISKWRNGHVEIPGEVIALLTLILASFVEDILDQMPARSESADWNFHQKAGLEAAREDLAAQEKINHELQPASVRAGAIRFRYWWNGRLRNQMAEMQINEARVAPAVSFVGSAL
ncbi:MAG: hypothetical protein HQ483_03150 [Rhodospirillales bacterium]|nr:hypothetical protein [Rhodospirillales bacterium]